MLLRCVRLPIMFYLRGCAVFDVFGFALPFPFSLFALFWVLVDLFYVGGFLAYPMVFSDASPIGW